MTNIDPQLRRTVEAWISLDPDHDTVKEANDLLDVDDAGGLRDRFDTRLAFGTAGLRGAIGVGPNRMNRLLVRQTAAGLADHLLTHVPDAATKGVVIGFDARHKSDAFAADTARVMAAKGIKSMLFPHVVPTPVVAFAVLHLGVAAGVQVTASHNPPADNGYKVYWGDGPQIVPPLDEEIAACIDAVAADPVAVVLAAPDHPLIHTVDESLIDAYLAGVRALDPHTSEADPRAALTIAYTAMHGVGGATIMRAFADAGFTNVSPVPEQFEPDPDFPTVAFPNPEEAGALDLAFAHAKKIGAHIIIANDPDADRLAVAIPEASRSAGWRALRGDELGWIMADHLLKVTASATRPRLVCTTIVSSSLLSAMAAAREVDYVETLTGFKWLARAALAHTEHLHVLSYEEALGYCVGSLVRDKDGISAGVVAADLAAGLLRDGSSIAERIAEIEAEFGRYDTEQWSLRFDGTDAQQKMGALMEGLRRNLPTSVAGVAVTEVRDLLQSDPSADVVVLFLADGTRLTVRPSGTEPKCKVYFETVTRAGQQPATIAELKQAMAEILGVPAA